jgi:hypothetical protein
MHVYLTFVETFQFLTVFGKYLGFMNFSSPI